jgi:hypothetical protein
MPRTLSGKTGNVLSRVMLSLAVPYTDASVKSVDPSERIFEKASELSL